MDKIAAKVLQIAASAVAPSLIEIFNMSNDSYQFPSEWKAAKVTLFFKKGQRSLMERILFNQIYEYFNQKNLFSKHQFGFTPYRKPPIISPALEDKPPPPPSISPSNYQRSHHSKYKPPEYSPPPPPI